ncbi:MAG TPA: DUF3597 domain-containing protein [Thermoanaerobaculia bacterium]|nr:DUF3597 domain-containing protein [Thermoanaerobaculia bacterium]
MGLFSNLMQKIFHAGANAAAPADAWKPGTSNESRVAASERTGIPLNSPNAAGMQMGGGAAPQGPVDIEAVLNGLAAKNSEKLDWKHSIVDLMKLVGMDSSLAERKELAKDLHYTGDTNDSAAMNMWLHKEVMRKLAENGGKVPADLLSH